MTQMKATILCLAPLAYATYVLYVFAQYSGGGEEVLAETKPVFFSKIQITNSPSLAITLFSAKEIFL